VSEADDPPPKRGRNAVVAVALLLAVVGVAVTSLIGLGGDEGEKVRVTTSAKKTITSRVRAQGKLRAKQQVDVASEVTGRVAEIYVEEGQRVAEGDALFRIDDEQLQNVVNQLRVALRAARATETRARLMRDEAVRGNQRDQKLSARGVLAGDALKSSGARVELANADLLSSGAAVERAFLELQRAEESLKKAKVVAPIAGTVVAVNMEVGQVVTGGISGGGESFSLPGLSPSVSTGTNIVVADLTEIIAKLHVDELDVARVKAGQRVRVQTQGEDDEEIVGSVSRVGLLGQDIGGAVQFTVEAAVAGGEPAPVSDAGVVVEAPEVEGAPGRVLRPGMSVTAEVEVETLVDAVAVPIGAVLEGDGREKSDRVFVVDDGVTGANAEEVEVTLGPSEGELIAVLSGLEAGQKIVEGPFRALRALEDDDPIVIDEEVPLPGDDDEKKADKDDKEEK
jgi:HlyD family secretion protein